MIHLLLPFLLAAPPAYVESPVVRSLSFSPDGTRLVAGVMPKDRGGIVVVWDVAARKPVARYDRAGDNPRAAFAPDGKSIVVANGQALLVVLDPTTGAKTGDLGPFPGEVTTVQPAGPGRWVALDKDGSLRVWDEKDKKVVREFRGLKRVWSWAVSPGGKWLFASSSEGGSHVWDLATGDEVKVPFRQRSSDTGTFAGDDRLVFGQNSGGHRVVELPSGKDVLRFKNAGGTGGLAYSPAAGVLATRYYSSPIANLTPLVFRAPTAAEAARTAELLKACDADDYATREKAAADLVALGPAVEPLLRQAAGEGASAEVRMRARLAREKVLNEPKWVLTGHTDDIGPMVFSPDGKVFATGAADGRVILWDPATGQELGRLGDP